MMIQINVYWVFMSLSFVDAGWTRFELVQMQSKDLSYSELMLLSESFKLFVTGPGFLM